MKVIPFFIIFEENKPTMKKLFILPLLLVSMTMFGQNVKVQTSDTSTMTILRHTWGLREEIKNVDGSSTFVFSDKVVARIVTNLATKKENVEYTISK
jgi:hypothetical protein